MKGNSLVDLSKQFAVDIVNVCIALKEKRKSSVKKTELLTKFGCYRISNKIA